MKLTEKEFGDLIKIAAWKRNADELLILAHKKETYYLGVRNLKTKDGMVCGCYPTPEVAQKAFLLSVMRSNPLPSVVDMPDLFRSQITLDEATAGFKETLNGTGHATCPCCEDHSVIYRRRIPVHGLTVLAIMVHKNVRWRDGKVDDRYEIPYMHIRDLPRQLIRSRSLGKIAKWKLVESAENSDPTKKSSGLWRPTITGANFVVGYFPVRSHVVLYRNKFLRYEGDLVYFKDIVKRFNYEELMNERGGIYKELNDV